MNKYRITGVCELPFTNQMWFSLNVEAEDEEAAHELAYHVVSGMGAVTVDKIDSDNDTIGSLAAEILELTT